MTALRKKAKPRSRKRKLTLARAQKEAAKAGIPVARYDMGPDGGVVAIIVGKPTLIPIGDNDDEVPTPIDRSEWQ